MQNSDTGFVAFLKSVMRNAKDYTAEIDAEDAEKNRVFAILAYIGPLFLVPLLAAGNSKFARFHAGQGLTFFLYCVIIYIVSFIFSFLGLLQFLISFIGSIIGFLFFVLGVYNAATGKAIELPYIGKFKIIK